MALPLFVDCLSWTWSWTSLRLLCSPVLPYRKQILQIKQRWRKSSELLLQKKLMFGWTWSLATNPAWDYQYQFVWQNKCLLLISMDLWWWRTTSISVCLQSRIEKKLINRSWRTTSSFKLSCTELVVIRQEAIYLNEKCNIFKKQMIPFSNKPLPMTLISFEHK